MTEAIERVPRTEQEAADSYTRLSKWYDHLGRSSEGPHIAEGLRLLNAQPGECVLEVGFGTGHSLVALAHTVGSTGQLVGIDLAEGMIAVAREQLRKDAAQSLFPSTFAFPRTPPTLRWRVGQGVPAALRRRRAGRIGHPGDSTGDHADKSTGFPPQARGNDVVMLNRGSALHLPYAAASFEAVFSSFMLDLIDTPDIPCVLGEMRRVLKPGGRLGLVSMSKACAGNAVVKVYERLHRWLPTVIDCRPIFLQHAVEATGLHCEVQLTRSMWGIPVEIVLATK